MSNALREKLLALGFKPAPVPVPAPAEARPRRQKAPEDRRTKAPERRAGASSPRENKAPGRRSAARSRSEEIDLARAYALRRRQEQAEQAAAERERQETARRRREAKARLAELLRDQTLNDPAAEIARHFPYGGRIKRIHVTEAQLRALNAGELGVVQLQGRYLLVSADVLAEAEAIVPEAVALKVDPAAPPDEDPYSDPKYRVPDDLVW